MSRNRLFSLSAAVYGCTVGRAFTPAALLILQRKRCFVFFEFAEVRRAKSPALRNREKHGGQPGKRGAALQQTPVGDDARIVPGTPQHRKVPGRAMPLPYKPSAHDRPNRTSAAARAAVGRGALTPPDPAAAQTPAGGINPAPTINGRPVPTGEPHLLQPMGASALMAFRFPPGRTPTRGRRHPPRSGAAARRTRRAAAAGGSAAS